MADHDELREVWKSPQTYCSDCECLTEALLDLEMQCREAEDEGLRALALASSGWATDIALEEQAYLSKINKLERRRNCALEVLLKHQRLEHAGIKHLQNE